MEVVDNGVMMMIPGAMDAGLLDLRFWGSMAIALAVAVVAAVRSTAGSSPAARVTPSSTSTTTTSLGAVR